MLTTTLKRIRAHHPCRDGWENLLNGLGKTAADDEPLPFSRIAEINGISDALWCCQVEPQHWRTWLRFAVWCARQVQHLMTDPRSAAALDVVERHIRGDATLKEMAAARAAARDAARDAGRAAWVAGMPAARAAAADAAWAARRVASVGAWDVGMFEASAAARDAAWAAASVAEAAAWAAARAAQQSKFIEMVAAAEEDRS